MFRNSFICRLSKKNDKTKKDAHFELTKCIQDYREIRKNLILACDETIKLFDEFSMNFISDFVELFDRDSLIKLKKELGENSLENEMNKGDVMLNNKIGNPFLVVLGQLNSGKSTFINNFIRKYLSPQNYTTCTDRVIKISYNDTNYIRIVKSDGKEVVKKYRTSVPMKYVSLKNHKKYPIEMNRIINVGAKVKFLENGIDIIDTPGIHEFDYLTYLSNGLLNNDFPIVIYVIDGRAGVKQTDTTDLIELINAFPNIEIIYFITHLDDENSEEEDPIDQANKKMDISFRKLQYHNFIPLSYKTWKQCPYFHGASLTCITDACHKQINKEIEYHLNKFSKFETDLENLIKTYFKNKILDSCEILLDFLMNILTKIVNQEENFKSKTKKNKDQINLIKKIEKEMYLKIKIAITSSKSDLISRLLGRLESESLEIINPIVSMIYPCSIQIPENGIVTDPEIVDQCQQTIMKVLIQGLENVLKRFVEEELFSNFKDAVKDKICLSINEIISNKVILKSDRSMYLTSLERLLNRNYKLERLSSISTDGNQTVVFEFMNVVLLSVKTFLSNGLITRLRENEVNVKNPEWKLKQAQEYLERCDHHVLAEEVCESLLKDFEAKHRKFKKSIEFEANLIETEILQTEVSRALILATKPNLYPLLVNVVNIKGKYIFNSVNKIEKIDSGAQSEVFKCTLNGNDIAVKEIKLDIYRLDYISKEIYYSHQFSHENILKILGILKSENGKSIQIFYPLMTTNLQKFIKFNIIDKKKKVKIALEIAEGLRYLHEQDVIHQDLKLQNILVNANNSICISDYGFCKSMALTTYYDERRPIHVAPEFGKNEFTIKIDVYSYGILLWYLFEATSREPKGTITLPALQQVVWDTSRFFSNSPMKPERLNKFPEEIWQLMSDCWSDNPDYRPDTSVVISELLRYTQTIEN